MRKAKNCGNETVCNFFVKQLKILQKKGEMYQKKAKKNVYKFCTHFFNSPILKTKHILQFLFSSQAFSRTSVHYFAACEFDVSKLTIKKMQKNQIRRVIFFIRQ
jgi:hypothetical protein